MTLSSGCRSRRPEVPPGISSVGDHDAGAEDIAQAVRRRVLSAIEPTVPSFRINTMSRGSSVFFIQKSRICGFAKMKSIIPASGAKDRRNIKPASCCTGVVANSTSNTRHSPFELMIVSRSNGNSAWLCSGLSRRPQAPTSKRQPRAMIFPMFSEIFHAENLSAGVLRIADNFGSDAGTVCR